jgi:hypothetical protein
MGARGGVPWGHLQLIEIDNVDVGDLVQEAAAALDVPRVVVDVAQRRSRRTLLDLRRVAECRAGCALVAARRLRVAGMRVAVSV